MRKDSSRFFTQQDAHDETSRTDGDQERDGELVEVISQSDMVRAVATKKT